MDNRAEALKAVNLAYSHRITSNLGVPTALPEPSYDGAFDYRAVAYAAPIPNPDNHDHKWHWAQLWEIFDQEWQAQRDELIQRPRMH